MEVSGQWLGAAAAAAVVGLVLFRLGRRSAQGLGVIPGKYTTEIEGEFVVFIIGIYLQPWACLWSLPTVIRAGRAMQSMLEELEAHPEYGCLLVRHTSTSLVNPTHLVQIWRSYDHLADYARNRMAKHLGTWLSYNAHAKALPGGEPSGVGIFHEAYVVSGYEAVYRNMPRIGLAQIGTIAKASHGRLRTGKGRLGTSDGNDHEGVGKVATAHQ